MSKTIEIRVPDIGDFENVEIIDLLVSAGDEVEKESPLITLETDKAAMDVPAPEAGTIKELKVGTGDKVSEGDLVAILEVADAAAAEKATDKSEAGEEKASDKSEEKPAEKKAEPEAPGGKSQVIEVKVPDIGDFDGVEIIDLLVKAGDEVEKESPLITLETDKAAMDVPAPEAGVIKELKVGTGDKVSEGDVIALLETTGAPAADKQEKGEPAASQSESTPAEDKQAAPQAAQGPASPPSSKGGKLPEINEASFSKAHASPSVRKFARELGVDLGRVNGTGVKGRINHDDVKQFVKSVMQGGGAGGGASLPSVPSVDFAKFGEIETKPLNRVKKISGPRLHASWVNVPHVTQHDLCDITD
ncbi:MAG: biotin/lipoyl-containing protein, partial [Gammaproteobacteria bacterium]|nr:biotin/lipoyl-containing protein [Gammaproteobacteria bacterium]